MAKKKRSRKAIYAITSGRLGPSILLLTSKRRVVNAINGGQEHSVEYMRRLAKRLYPEAREVKLT